MDSSKIKKEIRSIIFVSETKTIIKYQASFQPLNHNKVVDEELPLKSNMERHDDFNRAMARFKVHLMVRAELVEPKDRLGKVITKEYFDDHIFEEDDRFAGIDVESIIFTTKTDTTSFQIVGTKTTEDGEVIHLKSPVISTLTLADGYNYPLRLLADEHKETLLLEAQEFLKYKSNAMTLFSSPNVSKPLPKKTAAAAPAYN